MDCEMSAKFYESEEERDGESLSRESLSFYMTRVLIVCDDGMGEFKTLQSSYN